MLLLLLSHPDAWLEVCELAHSSGYLQRCVVAHMRGWGRLFVFSNILHYVWRVVLEQQEQELNNFPNGYLWPSEKYVLSLPIPHPRKGLIVLTPFLCHTHRNGIPGDFGFNAWVLLYIPEQTRGLHCFSWLMLMETYSPETKQAYRVLLWVHEEGII